MRLDLVGGVRHAVRLSHRSLFRRCLNGGQCVNAYGRPYCNCGLNFRGRRCELYYNRLNYVYLYQNPRW